jgi:hypothetical protein
MYTISRSQAQHPLVGRVHLLQLLTLPTLLALLLLLLPSAAARAARQALPEYANTHVFGAGDSVGRSAHLRSGASHTWACSP